MRLHEFIGNITYILNLKLDYTEHTWLVTAVSEPAQYKKFFCKSVEAANNGSNNKWFTTGDVMREHPPSATDPHALENRIKRFKEPWYFGVYRPTQARLPCIQGTTNLRKVSILSPPPLASCLSAFLQTRHHKRVLTTKEWKFASLVSPTSPAIFRGEELRNSIFYYWKFERLVGYAYFFISRWELKVGFKLWALRDGFFNRFSQPSRIGHRYICKRRVIVS